MLKFLACASALAMAAPSVAQIGPATPLADPLIETEIGVDAAADAPLDAAIGVDAQTDVGTRIPETTVDAGIGSDVTTDVGAADMTTEIDVAVEPIAPEANVAATIETAPMAAQAEATAEVNDPAQVEAYVAQEFPARDADGSGELSQDEFANWILPIFTEQLQQQMTQPEIDAWAEAAFAQTDTDQSNGISSVELQAFLTA